MPPGEHDRGAQVSEALRASGDVVDFRQPDVVRLASIALYTTCTELWQAARALREIIDTGVHLEAAAARR